MRYLGIDFGTKKIGLAIGDSETRVAAPADVVPDIDAVRRVITEEDIDELVVGIPGSVGAFHSEEQRKRTEAFIEEVKTFGKPVHTVDERFTSVESQRIQDETGTPVAEDALAAMLILQAFLDERD